MLPSDKEMDKLANDAAGQNEPAGPTPDWEAMQLLLDRHLPINKDRRKRPLLWLVFAFLLLGGFSYYYFSGDKTINKNNTIVEQNTGKKPGTTNKTANNKEEKFDDAIVDEKDKYSRSIDNSHNTDETNIQRSPIPGNNTNQPSSTDVTKSTAPTRDNENKLTRHNRAKTSKAGRTLTNIDQGLISENDEAINNEEKDLQQADTARRIDFSKNSTIKVTIATIRNDDPIASLSDSGKINVPDTGQSTIVKKLKKTETKKRPLEITLLYAPELTTIKFSNFDKPGSNYGLLVGYNVYKNLTLQTGVILSRKNYIADGKDYHLNYTVSPPYKLKSVKGYCNMYEIPLNVKYQVTKNKPFNIAVTAGLSSYIMTRESYTYEYASNYSSYSRSVKYKTQRNYWFSLAMIGASIEKEVSKNVNVAATPFIKIPFRGMGSGDLKFIGTGINFSIIYRPLLSNK